MLIRPSVAVVAIGIALTGAALAGCGGGSSSSPATGQPSSSNAQDQASATKGQAGQSAVADVGTFVSGYKLCGIEQVKEILRTTYGMDPSTEVGCAPFVDSEAPKNTAANWWLEGAENSGEEALDERISVSISEDEQEGVSAWAAQKALQPDPANDMELISVGGNEALFTQNFVLLMPVNADQDLNVEIYPGGDPSGPPAGARSAAIQVAELVAGKAFH